MESVFCNAPLLICYTFGMEKRITKRALHFTAGVLGLQGYSYAFDYFVYPVVIYALGPINGTLVLFLIALILNYVCIIIYDRIKLDLFGFETLKKLKAHGAESGKRSFMHRVLHWGDVPAFIALSWYDPIFAVLYKRTSTEFDGFKRRDYWLLILSTFMSCVMWSAIWGPAAYVVRGLIGRF